MAAGHAQGGGHGMDQRRVYAFPGRGHVAVGPHQGPRMAEDMAGALQMAQPVDHVLHRAKRTR